MTTMDLHPVDCPLCPGGPSVELYRATASPSDLRADVFSARRRPDRVHFRMVRCLECGLVRSDPVADPGVVAALYRESSLHYGPEVPNLIRTYSRHLGRVASLRSEPSAFLEVGAGSGFMVGEAIRLGYSTVVGLEPSRDAVEHAEEHVRPHLVCDVLGPGVVEAERFDTVAMFQVLDHLNDPVEALDLCREALKPGGRLLAFNHNVRALSARLMGERSPIVDVEHTFLYDTRTLARLCESRGYVVERAVPAWNWCSLNHLAHMLPLPDAAKNAMISALRPLGLGGARLFLPIGNLCVVARKAPA